MDECLILLLLCIYLVLSYSVTQSCPTLGDPMDGNTPGFPSPRVFLKLISIESMLPSNHLVLCRPLLLMPSILPSIRVFSHESALRIRGKSLGASLASVLQMNTWGWFSVELTSLISLQSKEVSRVFSNITVQKHQFFSAQHSLWSNSHMYT